MKKFNKGKVVKNIKTGFFENYKIKLACFFLAILMYFTIGFLQRSTKTFSSELKITNLRDYLVIANELPEMVKIIAKDKKNVFDKVTEEDFNVRLDLSEITNPTSTTNNNEIKVKLKWDVPEPMHSFFSSINIEPSELSVRIEKLIEKNVRVILIPIGKEAPGYIIKKVTIDPSVIRIQGPENIINKIDSINTETINIEGVKESFGRQVNLISEYPMVKALGKVNVFFEVVEETGVVAFKYQKIKYENLKKQFKASIKKNITIKLEGPKNSIPKITSEDLILYVDCSGLVYPGEYQLEVKVKKPDEFKIISITPEKINVIIKDK